MKFEGRNKACDTSLRFLAKDSWLIRSSWYRLVTSGEAERCAQLVTTCEHCLTNWCNAIYCYNDYMLSLPSCRKAWPWCLQLVRARPYACSARQPFPILIILLLSKCIVLLLLLQWDVRIYNPLQLFLAMIFHRLDNRWQYLSRFSSCSTIGTTSYLRSMFRAIDKTACLLARISAEEVDSGTYWWSFRCWKWHLENRIASGHWPSFPSQEVYLIVLTHCLHSGLPLRDIPVDYASMVWKLCS